MRIRSHLTSALVLALLARAPDAGAQHDHAAAGAVGTVSFPTSCASAVQPQFERGVAALHSFWFEAATAAFDSVIASDPKCAMAHWGASMTLLYNPFTMVAPDEARRRAALAHAEHALANATTTRERGYAQAAVALWADPTTGLPGHQRRMKLHEAAMQALHEGHPDDPEAAIFLARAIIANAPPSDLTFARQQEAAKLLEPLFARQPQHPGLAHYIIHTFDSPRMATQGLEAARRYASIAPAAPHALHMPSHIFTRLGHWQESIETNRRSANAEPKPDAAVHPLDYMVYAYLQLGRDADARRVIEKAVNLEGRFYAGIIAYNYTAMHARYALEREDWEGAAKLDPPAGAAPAAVAVTHFARALGAARAGRPADARADVDALARIRDTLKARGDGYWPTVVEAQRLAAAAWVAKAEGRGDEALRLAREGAELEESVEKHPVTPGPLLPARELEGDLLLALGRHEDAFASYEKTLTREPRRARALFGAARSAELAKRADDARKYYTELLDLMRDADLARPEVRSARRFLAAR